MEAEGPSLVNENFCRFKGYKDAGLENFIHYFKTEKVRT